MSTELKQDAVVESFVMERLAHAHSLLRTEITRAIPYRWKGHFVVSTDQAPEPTDAQEEAEDILVGLFQSLPRIRALLVKDVEAAYLGDPAATNFAEVVLAYPGVRAVTTHRIAHELYKLDAPIIPRMMGEHAHMHTGIDIHPGARIGESFFIDHGTGVVIGETCEIGNRVKLYQGVTLGAKSFPVDENGVPIKGIKRHPTIEDDVVIYAGATILGGKTVIGKGSVVGGNVWLAKSVEPGSTVLQKNVEIEIRNGEQ
ncbi:MAG: serine acetyltransferase [Armatimonadia bacterium]|nr:serine acetyltransferase [Armatimonadia bacterium]